MLIYGCCGAFRIGDIPSFKLLETQFNYSFLDIGPLSKGHALVIPKCTCITHHSQLLRDHDHADICTDVRVDHAEKLTEVPDEYLADTLPLAKKIASALGAENYNLLQVRSTLSIARYAQVIYLKFLSLSTCTQNNGKLAHQEVPHIHFHVIPKPNEEEGLIIGWPQQKPSMDDLKAFHQELLSKL